MNVHQKTGQGAKSSCRRSTDVCIYIYICVCFGQLTARGSRVWSVFSLCTLEGGLRSVCTSNLVN